MLFWMFILLLICSAGAIIFGFYKANFVIFLLGAGLLCFTGVMIQNEGLTYGQPSTTTTSDGTTIQTLPITEHVNTSNSLYAVTQFMFFGGFFLVGLSILVPMINFARRVLGGS